MASKISKASHAVLDIKSRKEKAAAIIKILGRYKNIKDCRILDIGTGSGVIAHEIGKISKNVYSVDIRDERVLKSNFKFKKIKNEKLPFNGSEFDIVLSNHVMAHVKNQEMHLKEISRVLKSGGVAYLSMLNKLCLIEPNFNLPFLSWLPKKFADIYVKLVRKGKHYDVSPLTYHNFIKKVSKDFAYDDVTIELVKQKISVANIFYSLLKTLCPVWVLVLKKIG